MVSNEEAEPDHAKPADSRGFEIATDYGTSTQPTVATGPGVQDVLDEEASVGDETLAKDEALAKNDSTVLVGVAATVMTADFVACLAFGMNHWAAYLFLLLPAACAGFLAAGYSMQISERTIRIAKKKAALIGQKAKGSAGMVSMLVFFYAITSLITGIYEGGCLLYSSIRGTETDGLWTKSAEQLSAGFAGKGIFGLVAIGIYRLRLAYKRRKISRSRT